MRYCFSSAGQTCAEMGAAFTMSKSSSNRAKYLRKRSASLGWAFFLMEIENSLRPAYLAVISEHNSSACVRCLALFPVGVQQRIDDRQAAGEWYLDQHPRAE